MLLSLWTLTSIKGRTAFIVCHCIPSNYHCVCNRKDSHKYGLRELIHGVDDIIPILLMMNLRFS